MWSNYSLLNHNCIAPTIATEGEWACIPPTQTWHWDTKRMEAGYLVSNKTESSPRQGREGQPGRLAGRGGEGGGRGVCVHYAYAKSSRQRVAAVTAHSSPKLAITFTPIISAASHPMPDIYTPVVNAPILTICHMLLCLLGRICHKELIVVTSLKVLVISKMPVSIPTLENKM